MEVTVWGVEVQSAKVVFSLQQKIGSDSAVLISVGSSFHHFRARTERSLDRGRWGSQSYTVRAWQWFGFGGWKKWLFSVACRSAPES